MDYLDPQGIVNFYAIPWTTLNLWLSALNGNVHAEVSLPSGLNRGDVIRELYYR